MNEVISHMYDPFHPALIRMLQLTIEAAKRKGIKVGVCGELAGDVRALPIWLSLDVDELSMSSSSILQVKERVLRTTQHESRKLFTHLHDCHTSTEILDQLNSFIDHLDKKTANG